MISYDAHFHGRFPAENPEGQVLHLYGNSYISTITCLVVLHRFVYLGLKMPVYSKLVVAFKKYPLLRGMASYSVIWPISSLIQQTFEGKNMESYDWGRCARYGLYGSCYVAPTLYTWLTVASIMWPGNTIRAGVIKTFVETITYTPFAMCSFYFGMSLLEMKPLHEAMAEVKSKFLPTYKVGASVWPAVAMINFCFIPARNRVPFISMCSLIWTCFLAYMKHLDKENIPQNITPSKLLKINI